MSRIGFNDDERFSVRQLTRSLTARRDNTDDEMLLRHMRASWVDRHVYLYVLRNSGLRVWLAVILVEVAGRLNPAKPWRRVPHHIKEREVLAEAMDYFMTRDGATYVVDALAQRRETGRWPSE